MPILPPEHKESRQRVTWRRAASPLRLDPCSLCSSGTRQSNLVVGAITICNETASHAHIILQSSSIKVAIIGIARPNPPCMIDSACSPHGTPGRRRNTRSAGNSRSGKTRHLTYAKPLACVHTAPPTRASSAKKTHPYSIHCVAERSATGERPSFARGLPCTPVRHGSPAFRSRRRHDCAQWSTRTARPRRGRAQGGPRRGEERQPHDDHDHYRCAGLLFGGQRRARARGVCDVCHDILRF